MKALERIELLDAVGSELQSRFTFDDIDRCARAWRVYQKLPGNWSSKRVYAKALLEPISEGKLLQIAEELGLVNASPASIEVAPIVPTFWAAGHFRLFLSHLASFKVKTAALRDALRPFGISAFVAHEDIEPTREWQVEIEAGLQTADALVAILMPGFKESSWCDQEVGFAVARNIVVIPLIKGLDPYGFISKVQGMPAEGKKVVEIAELIYGILLRSPKTREKMVAALINTLPQARTPAEALKRIKLLEDVKDLPRPLLEQLSVTARGAAIFAKEPQKAALAKLLRRYGIGVAESEHFVDDDLPF
ncbi:MAG TPA: toll/interleukin-1 receptor domain-containing protein [Stenotrophomonas sp.]|jgi:hypothetical protein